MIRILTLISTLLLIANAEEQKQPTSVQEARQEMLEQFRPMLDTMRAKQLAQLATIYSDENEAMREMVPYLIFNMIKFEIENLERSSYDNADLETMRKDALEKLYEARKEYADYSDITKFLEKMADQK